MKRNITKETIIEQNMKKLSEVKSLDFS